MIFGISGAFIANSDLHFDDVMKDYILSGNLSSNITAGRGETVSYGVCAVQEGLADSMRRPLFHAFKS